MFYGNWSAHLLPTSDLSKFEFGLILPLVFFTFFLGIFPNIILTE